MDSVSGKTFPTLNPATGEVIAQVQEGNKVRSQFLVKRGEGQSELRTQLYKRVHIYIFKCRYFDGLGRHLLRQNFVAGIDATPSPMMTILKLYSGIFS